MSYGFPDWMFAAVAITAYELAVWARHRFDYPWVMWVAYFIIASCAVVVLIRYIIRRRHEKNPSQNEDEDDWRNY